MRALSSRHGAIVLLAGLALAGAAEAQTRGAVRGGPAVSPSLGFGGPRMPGFGPGRSPVMAGDVFSSAGPSAFQRRTFGYGRLLGRGVVAPIGFGGYGYGGYGFGYGGYGLPLTGGILDPFGLPLGAGAPPEPSFPVVSHPEHGPSLIGIAPSPVKPPAIYVIGGDRRPARTRSSVRDVPMQGARNEALGRQASGEAPIRPQIITIGSDRS